MIIYNNIAYQFELIASFQNRCRDVNMYQVHPWVHQYTNNLKPEHQTQAVSFPDVSPSDLPGTAQFSMTAGDFLEVNK